MRVRLVSWNVWNWDSLPSRTFRAEVHLDHDNEGRNRGRRQHPAPLCVLSKEIGALESNGGDETQHDSESSPHLPHHGESTTDVFGCGFGGVHRSGTGLCADGETEGETSDEKVDPVVGGTHPDTSDERDEAGDEDGSAASEIFLQARCQWVDRVISTEMHKRTFKGALLQQPIKQEHK